MTAYTIRHVVVTASTNDDARHAAEQGDGEGLVIWADQQTAGRGRLGRDWQSPTGNLHCSVLLRPKAEPRDIALYSYVAADAMYDTVRQCLPVAEISLKWPNDVLVDGKKIGGILLERAGTALIVGMGLNVVHHPAQGLYPSTSLRAARAQPKQLDEILDMLLQNLAHWHGLFQKDGFAPVRDGWLKHAQKGLLTARLPHEEVKGEFAGLDETGHLRLRLADGAERSIATGDVFFGT